jgi:hypothetical protein
MWSFPIIRHGLVYVVDIRNGLFVLRYTSAHAQVLDERAGLTTRQGERAHQQQAAAYRSAEACPWRAARSSARHGMGSRYRDFGRMRGGRARR